MKQFLKPSYFILGMLAVLILIVEWAGIDSWRYVRQGSAGLQDPPLYEFVAGNPLTPAIWIISFVLLLPAYPLVFIFAFILPIDSQDWASRYWSYIYIIPYLYLVSCVVSFVFKKLKRRFAGDVAA